MAKTIMGVQLLDRMQNAADFQALLSKYGCYIQTRIGLHKASPEACSASGLILLDFMDNTEEQVAEFEKELSDLGNAIVKKMVF